jgi:hypothetical protein
MAGNHPGIREGYRFAGIIQPESTEGAGNNENLFASNRRGVKEKFFPDLHLWELIVCRIPIRLSAGLFLIARHRGRAGYFQRTKCNTFDEACQFVIRVQPQDRVKTGQCFLVPS